jgi:hypothetical protein
MIYSMPMQDHEVCYLEMRDLNRKFDLGTQKEPFQIQGIWRLPLKEVCVNFKAFVLNQIPQLQMKTRWGITEFNAR